MNSRALLDGIIFVIQTDKSIAKRRVSDENKYYTEPKWDSINTKKKMGISEIESAVRESLCSL